METRRNGMKGKERKKERARETFFMTSAAVGHGREQCKEMLDHLALQRTH